MFSKKHLDFCGFIPYNLIILLFFGGITFNILRKGLRIEGSVFVVPVVGGIFNTIFVFAEDGFSLGLKREYCKIVDDEHFRFTLKGALIAFTFGYLWNEDFRKFVDESFDYDLKRYLGIIVLPSVFWMALLVDLLMFWSYYIAKKERGNFLLIRDNIYVRDDVSVSTKASRKNEENDSVNLLMDDADERYLFSPIVEEKSKREAELILFENLEYRN